MVLPELKKIYYIFSAYSIQESVYIYSDLTEKQVDLSSTRSLHSYKRNDKTCENEEKDNSFIEKLRLKRFARRSQQCEQLESVRNLNPTPTEEKTQPRYIIKDLIFLTSFLSLGPKSCLIQ